jgi:hypothetical protein
MKESHGQDAAAAGPLAPARISAAVPDDVHAGQHQSGSALFGAAEWKLTANAASMTARVETPDGSVKTHRRVRAAPSQESSHTL